MSIVASQIDERQPYISVAAYLAASGAALVSLSRLYVPRKLSLEQEERCVMTLYGIASSITAATIRQRSLITFLQRSARNGTAIAALHQRR